MRPAKPFVRQSLYVIRPARDEDGPEIATLIETIFGEYPGCPFVMAEFVELNTPATHYRARGGDLWVMTPESDPLRVVGSFGVSRVDATAVFELHKVYLAAGLRGQGWTDKLFAVALDFISRQGGQSIRLWSDVRFERAHSYYARRGFDRVQITRYLADATRAWEYAFLASTATVSARLPGYPRA